MKRLNFVLVIALAAPACTVAATGTLSTTTPVVYLEPPQEQVENHPLRPGYLWAKGRWDWQEGHWVWIDGHWERTRANQAWEAGRWERRGSSWHWIEGRWVNAAPADPAITPPVDNGGPPVVVNTPPARPMYPTAAPPPSRTENFGAPRAGYVWVGGRWDWQSGEWQWLDGHWERQQANQAWVPGRWELQGSYYVWVEGRWDSAPTGPVVRDHR